MPSHYPLASAQALAQNGAFQVRGKKGRDELREYLDGLGFEKRVRAFAAAMIARLQPRHFVRTATDMYYQETPTAYDIYGVPVAKAELVALGFPDDGVSLPLCWMLKLAIVEDTTLLDVLSLHSIDEPLRLENNTFLSPRGST